MKFHKLDILTKTSEQYFEDIYDKTLVHTMATKDNPNALIIGWKDILLNYQKDHDIVVKTFEYYIKNNKDNIKLLSKET